MKHHLQMAETLAKTLDNQFKVLGFRFGLDPLIGLIPGFGDILPFFVTGYFIWVGNQIGLPQEKVTEMLINNLVDFIVGLVPIIGDIGDFAVKSHAKNYQILHEHYQTHQARITHPRFAV